MVRYLLEEFRKKLEDIKTMWGRRKRWKKIRRIANRSKEPLVAYYPGCGEDKEVARNIGAGVQISIDRDEDVQGIPEQAGQRRAIHEGPLTFIYYNGDALYFFPPELEQGIDIFINKHWQFGDYVGYSNLTPNFKSKIYNSIREMGFELNAKEKHIFRALNPNAFGYQLVLDSHNQSRQSERGPSQIKIFQKKSNQHLPKEIFEIDKILMERTPGRKGKGLAYTCLEKEYRYLQEKYRTSKSILENSEGNCWTEKRVRCQKKELEEIRSRKEYFINNEREIRERRLKELMKKSRSIDNQSLSKIIKRELERLLC